MHTIRGSKAHNPVGITGLTQSEPSKDTMRAPTAVESTAPNNPPISTVPEAETGLAPCAHTATDSRRAPTLQTSRQVPNVSRKMGAEMDRTGTRKRPLTENKSVKRI